MKVLVDNIRSASNIGSIFRTCDAFAVDKIFLCGISAVPPNKEILKTALGATSTVAWEYHADAVALIHSLKQHSGCLIVAIEQYQNSIPLQQFNLKSNQDLILILGNEVDGVSPEILSLSDVVLEIPQFGSKKSLNVAVAGGIAIWDILVKQRLKIPSA